MATSFLPNLFSFFTPSKQPPPPSSLPVPPPSQISISSTNLGFSSDELRSNPSMLSSSDVTSVICPSLAYANTLFFRSAYNVQVIVDDNEPEEKLLGRFRREVMRAGVIQECKRRRFFENKQDEKKRRTRDAAKRNRRSKRPQWKNFTQDREEASKTKKRDDDEDNWDVPEGALG